MVAANALDEVVQSARRVRLALVRGQDAETVVVDLSEPAERERLRAALAIGSLSGMVCACAGDVRFEFSGEQGQGLGAVTLHHGRSLRWTAFESDAVLVDGWSLLRWLEGQGLAEPLQRAEEAVERQREASEVEKEWVAAMPPALAEFADRMLATSRTGSSASPELIRQAQERLAQGVPTPVMRTLALLAWCGAGTGRYSGYPVHEKIPGLLLKEVPMAEIIAALEYPQAGARHFAGAVRHLTGWKSRQELESDLGMLPPEVTARLRSTAEASGDEDTRNRARHVFNSV